MGGYVEVHDGPIPIGKPGPTNQDQDFFEFAAPEVSSRGEAQTAEAGQAPQHVASAKPEGSLEAKAAQDDINTAGPQVSGMNPAGSQPNHASQDGTADHPATGQANDQQGVFPNRDGIGALHTIQSGLTARPSRSARQRLEFYSPSGTPVSSAAAQLEAHPPALTTSGSNLAVEYVQAATVPKSERVRADPTPSGSQQPQHGDRANVLTSWHPQAASSARDGRSSSLARAKELLARKARALPQVDSGSSGASDGAPQLPAVHLPANPAGSAAQHAATMHHETLASSRQEPSLGVPTQPGTVASTSTTANSVAGHHEAPEDTTHEGHGSKCSDDALVHQAAASAGSSVAAVFDSSPIVPSEIELGTDGTVEQDCRSSPTAPAPALDQQLAIEAIEQEALVEAGSPEDSQAAPLQDSVMGTSHEPHPAQSEQGFPDTNPSSPCERDGAAADGQSETLEAAVHSQHALPNSSNPQVSLPDSGGLLVGQGDESETSASTMDRVGHEDVVQRPTPTTNTAPKDQPYEPVPAAAEVGHEALLQKPVTGPGEMGHEDMLKAPVTTGNVVLLAADSSSLQAAGSPSADNEGSESGHKDGLEVPNTAIDVLMSAAGIETEANGSLPDEGRSLVGHEYALEAPMTATDSERQAADGLPDEGGQRVWHEYVLEAPATTTHVAESAADIKREAGDGCFDNERSHSGHTPLKDAPPTLADTEKKAGGGVPEEEVSKVGHEDASEAPVTATDVVVLAAEIERLELALAAEKRVAERSAAEAAAARADSEALRARNAEASEQAEDVRAELEAVRGAYTDMRAEAEATREELSKLRADHANLQKQAGHSSTASLQQAAEARKMQMRLEKAERAIEQERATIKQLQQALQAAQQASPCASPRNGQDQLRAALAAAQRQLAENSALLEAQRQTSNGLQIRVEELLQITAEVEQLRRRNAELQESNNAMQAREGDLRSALNRAVEESKQARAAAASLREQNKSLHVTTERLLSTNSELAAKLNVQSAQITSLEQQLASAPAPAPLAASDSQAAGVRFSETDLELLALAEYAQQLEAALERQKASTAALPYGIRPSDQKGASQHVSPRESASGNGGVSNSKKAASPDSASSRADTKIRSHSSVTPSGEEQRSMPSISIGQAAAGVLADQKSADNQHNSNHQSTAEAPVHMPKAKPRRTSLWGYITGIDKTPLRTS